MKKIFLALLFGTLFIPNFVFAQTASSTLESAQVAELIAQLQAQIKQLQAQLVEIQQSSGAEVINTPEFVAVNEFTQTLSRGMQSEEVKELQRFLAQNPEIYPEGVISGYFGALTEEAVKRFQEAHSLPSVGIVGPMTRAVLNENISSSGGGGGVTQSTVSTITTLPVSPPPPPAPTPATQAVTAPPPSPTPTVASTGSYYGSHTGGGINPSTPTYSSVPTPPPPPPSPPPASSTSTASTTPPAPPPPPSPSPEPLPPPPANDTTGPTITSLTITPVSTIVAGAVSFSATAEDPSGVGNLIYDIRYPASPQHDGYYLRPNCPFNGVSSGTCAFGESIDHGIQNPSILGNYVIEKIRVTDMLGNLATYYPDGTVTNGVNATHNLTIPAITISAP